MKSKSILYDDRLLALSKHNAIVMQGLREAQHGMPDLEALISMVLAFAEENKRYFDELVLQHMRTSSPVPIPLSPAESAKAQAAIGEIENGETAETRAIADSQYSREFETLLDHIETLLDRMQQP